MRPARSKIEAYRGDITTLLLRFVNTSRDAMPLSGEWKSQARSSPISSSFYPVDIDASEQESGLLTATIDGSLFRMQRIYTESDR